MTAAHDGDRSMDKRNDEEYARLREMRELKKEEARRAAYEAQLEKERAVRIASLKRNAAKVSEKLLSVGKRLPVADGMGVSCLRYLPALFSVIAVFFRRADRLFNISLRKTGIAVCRFAGNAISLPVFVLLAIGSYYSVMRLCGFNPLRVDVMMPTFQFYLCDYSVGFCTRLFVGTVISLFADKVSVAMMNGVFRTVLIAALSGQVLLSGIFLRSALKNRSVIATILSVLFLTNPLLVCGNMSAPGLMDAYLLLLFLVWLPLRRTPLNVILTPAVCFVGMAIHYEFVFMFLPPMMTLLFYDAVFLEKKSMRVRGGISLAAGGAVSVALGFYFVLFFNRNLRMTSDEFYAYMISRFAMRPREEAAYTMMMGAPIFRDYFDYNIFGENPSYGSFETPKEFIAMMRTWAASHFDASVFWKDMVIAVGIFVPVLVLWVICAGKEKGARRLPYLAFVAQLIVLVPVLLLSTDIWRWMLAALLSQVLVFQAVYLSRDAVLHEVTKGKKVRPLLAVLLMVCAVAYSAFCVTLI